MGGFGLEAFWDGGFRVGSKVRIGNGAGGAMGGCIEGGRVSSYPILRVQKDCEGSGVRVWVLWGEGIGVGLKGQKKE